VSQSNIQWGWRVQCAEEGCEDHLEVWGPIKEPQDDPTTPCLIGDTYSRERSREGWYFYSHPAPRHQRFYRAFCPTHAQQVWEWRENLEAWHQARRGVGAETSQGILDRLQEWGRSLFNKNMGDRMKGWEGKNPKPTPPWEKTDV
jgi:hypothetical protein